MYKSLETIPYKKFIKIFETEEVHLLSKSDKDLEDFSKEEIEKFKTTWEKIKREYLEILPSDDEMRIMDIHKEIDYLNSKYKLINMCCECLIFDWNEQVVAIVRDNDFIITDKNYYKDIELILSQSKSILDNIEGFKNQLPKDKLQASKKITIDAMMASICVVLGIVFDFNTISFTAVNAYLEQVQAKIKSLENK